MANEVKTYNASSLKCMYSVKCATAEAAHKEYCDIIENTRRYCPNGYRLIVIRYADGKIMAMTEARGEMQRRI